MVASSVPAWARGTKAADTVLVNGEVWTVDASMPWASAVAIRNGRIVFVGKDDDARAFVGAGTEVINLRGRMAMPGIHDGHIHPLSGGRTLTAASLNYAQLTLPQFLDRIARLPGRHRRPRARHLAHRRPVGRHRDGRTSPTGTTWTTWTPRDRSSYGAWTATSR